MKKEKEKFFTERDKILLKLLFITYFIFAIVLNWGEVVWYLNLNTAPGIISERVQDLFSRGGGGDDLIDKEENEEDIEELEEEDYVYCQEDKVSIPSIDIDAPVVETIGITETEYRESLDSGVVRFPGSGYPGQEGLTILLGHSAPPGWPDINFDRIFTEIDKLEEGDKIEVCYDNRLSVYTVIDKERGQQIYEVGDDVPPLYPNENKKELVLMTCWPPGSSENRMGVRAIIE